MFDSGRKKFVTIFACCGLVALAAVLSVQAQPATGACADIANLKLDHVTINEAVPVPASALPAYCKVSGSAHPTPDSDIRFAVMIPQGWNVSYFQIGHGVFAGV